jgi:signal transduction histidine kinase
MSDGESGTGDRSDSSGTNTDSGREETPPDAVADVTRDPDNPVPGRKIRRLHEVATAMQTATSVEDIYALTVDAAVDILGFDWCAVEVAVEGYFEVAAVSEEAPMDVGTRPITTDHGVTGDVYMRGESSVIHDTHANPDSDPTLEEFRSGLTVPLGDRGVFQGISSETAFFDEDDLELAELLIAHTTAALDRVEETERLNELNRATRQLLAAETHEAVAREGCEIASSVLNTPLTTVYYHENALVPMAATETAREVLDGPETVESGDHPAWTAIADGKTVRRHDESAEQPLDWEGLYVPLGDHGVLRVGSPVQGAFDESNVALAETLAANIEAAFARADREQRRREQARQLQRQNERLDRFASIVSHDLRNPLHVAATRAALARDERDSEHLASLEDALERMETIIDDTLSLARKGQAVEETESVSLNGVASRSWNQVETGGASLEIVGDEVVRADPDRLRNVFENLFRNVVEHGSTSPDSQACQDAVEHDSTSPRSSSTREDAVEHGVNGESNGLAVRIGRLPGGFYVEDTGQGIPVDRREEVFDLGHSGDKDGTGFGLAIVAEIVESHGWEVEITESDEGGTRFEITGVGVE